MHINSIVLKGNDKGIRLIIADDASINEVLFDLETKLPKTNHYYQTKRPILISFEGKYLTMDEKNLILNALKDKGLNIQEDKQFNKTNDHYKRQIDKDGLFYVGNLKNGQMLEAKDSIIIIGNVEQGAAVYSEGNIIITGILKGYAQAGYKGNSNAFVYSYMSERSL